MPPPDPKLLGETYGFWCQTGSLIAAAILAYLTLRSSRAIERRKAAANAIFAGRRDKELTEAVRRIAALHASERSISSYGREENKESEEAKIIRYALPAGATCNFSPVTVSSTGSMSSTLTINSAVSTAAIRTGTGVLLSGSSLAVALCFVRRRGRRSRKLLFLLPMSVAAMTLFVGCSKSPVSQTSTGDPSSGTATSPAVTTVTVTATSGSVMHAATFTLTVNSTAPAT